MGMLQLAGMVSGFGKGVGRGLENMQQTMSTMQLLGIRDEMERARMKETWGHDEGMLQKRQAFEVKQADAAHSRQLDLREQDQDFQAGQARIGREESRQKEGRDAERQKELEERQYKSRINELVVREGYSQQEAARKAKEERGKEERERLDKTKARQEDTGKDIVLETIRGQNRIHSGTGANTETSNRLKVITDEIHSEEDKLKDVMLKPEQRAQIEKRLAALQAERRGLTGLPSTQAVRPGYKFPD